MSLEESYANEILNSIAEGLFTVDKNFKIVFFNRAAEKITGMHREEVIGRICKQIFKSNLCFTECPIARVLETDQNQLEVKATIQQS